MPRGFFFFMPIKINLMSKAVVIRYKMVVGGTVCQKSIAKAVHFTLPTGRYVKTKQSECGYVNTHIVFKHMITHKKNTWNIRIQFISLLSF